MISDDGDGKPRKRYRVRWRDPDGRQRAKTFNLKRAAEQHQINVAADLLRGQYVDPDAGKETFESYATRWLAVQTFDLATANSVADRLRLHAHPVLGAKPLRQIKPSTIQAWLRSMEALAPNYRKVIFANVSTVFAAAVDDEELRKNPCRAPSVQRPKAEREDVVPWLRETVLGVRDALPKRYRIVVTLAAGLGLRQGEVFGLSPSDVDFLRGKVEVRRQVKLFRGNKQVFGLPKGRKVRTVPLPDSVRDTLAAYLTEYPTRPVTLPWDVPDGKPVTVDLILTNRETKAMNRNYFNPFIWKKALEACGVEPVRTNGCHALRHFYASTLLDAGESIKALSMYLGHSDPGFTLRTYTHLMPTSDERTRKAVDAMLGVQGVYSAPVLAHPRR
ncbi:MAG TPA: site-specific integrase [Jiangellaceae bacterium]